MLERKVTRLAACSRAVVATLIPENQSHSPLTRVLPLPQVYLSKGHVHLIPLASSPASLTPLPSGTPSVMDAVSTVRRLPEHTRASPQVQAAVTAKVDGSVLSSSCTPCIVSCTHCLLTFIHFSCMPLPSHSQSQTYFIPSWTLFPSHAFSQALNHALSCAHSCPDPSLVHFLFLFPSFFPPFHLFLYCFVSFFRRCFLWHILM